jgi:hypothetical protein
VNRQCLQTIVQADHSGSANCFPSNDGIQFEPHMVCDFPFTAFWDPTSNRDIDKKCSYKTWAIVTLAFGVDLCPKF